ncbi:hypothetical protein G6011_02604, partial [Alternaria panax]
MPTYFFNKIGFDLGHTGRARQTCFVGETIRLAYEKNSTSVNIAIENMH